MAASPNNWRPEIPSPSERGMESRLTRKTRLDRSLVSDTQVVLVRQARADGYDILGGERQTPRPHRPIIGIVPMRFHDACRGMAVGAAQNVPDLVGQHMPENARLEERLMTGKGPDPVEKHGDANTAGGVGTRLRQGVGRLLLWSEIR